jgi:NAD(P)H-dependent flavin oxidoreductase YrpB (nitropropane dioxygenase family)
VNFLMDAPGADVITEAIVRRGVCAAGYNRSPDASLIGKLKDAGVLCVPTCGAPRHVEKAVKLGADAVIVQGAEGGGHTGNIPTSLLVPASARLVDAPIIAAGGFQDGRGLVAALSWGAAGIAMGTRFLLTAESPVPTVTTDRYLGAGVGDIVVTQEIDGLPQRVIVNELLRKLEGAGPIAKLWLAFKNAVELRASTGASPLALLRTALALRKNERLTRSQIVMAANAPILAKRAMQDGDPVQGYLPSGTVSGLIEDRPSCAELVARIMDEAEETLKRLQIGG